MFQQLYVAIVCIAALELLYIGNVIAFFQQKIIANDILKLVIAALLSFVFLIVGRLIGNLVLIWISESSVWYAATIIFILGLKMFYDKIKLGKIKQFINPLETKGLLTLTVLQGINIFFIGLASVLLKITSQFSIYSLLIFIFAVVLGYSLGFILKKESKRQFEFLSGIFYIIIAIVIASNI